MRAACVVLIVLLGAGFLVSCKRSVIQADEDDILTNCPFDLSDGFDWNFYPPENVIGFTAFGREDLDGMRTDIFVFDLRTAEYGSIITGTEWMETFRFGIAYLIAKAEELNKEIEGSIILGQFIF